MNYQIVFSEKNKTKRALLLSSPELAQRVVMVNGIHSNFI